MLRELHPDLWTIDENFTMSGLEIGARMLIVRLRNGDLWIHAPFAIDDADAAAIRDLGEVKTVVVPNNFHYLQVGELARRFSGAQVWAPPQLKKKLKDVPHRELLEIPQEWRDDFDALRFDSLIFHEWAFCHRASRTLILTDLIVNLPRPRNAMGRIVSRIADVGRGFKPTRLERMMLRTGKRSELKKSMETVLSWDFERVSMAHGQVLESGGNAALKRGYRWLLK